MLQSYLPLFVVCVTVAVVLGVSAVPVDATGTFLDARPRAPPVEMLLAAPTHPPRVRGPVWGAKTDTHTHTHKQKHRVSSFQKKNSQLLAEYHNVQCFSHRKIQQEQFHKL